MDWQQVALFGAGLAVGVVVGAGVALLSAPRSGAETRLALSRTARRGVRHTRDAWDDLGDELRAVRRLLRRRRARSVRAGGLEAGDGWDAGAGRPAPAR